MKKIILFLGVMLAFAACSSDKIEVQDPQTGLQTDGQDEIIKVNINIERAGFSGTKASVKSAFADDDVVFIFFKGIDAPKYMEMKYDAAGGTWTATAKNSLIGTDLSGAADKKMTAVYLPYGSGMTVEASGDDFVFSGDAYCGFFLTAELQDYTYEADVLSGNLYLEVPALSNASDKYVHFDVSGFTPGNSYEFYQEFVKPISFASVSAAGVLTKTEGTAGDPITGYQDGSMMSFSGILVASAVAAEKDYDFSVDDLTSSIIYTRFVEDKTLSGGQYIGIGNISSWTATPYVDLGLPSGKKWATCNLGAANAESAGSYYAWGETATKSNYAWSTYTTLGNGSSNGIIKYCETGSKYWAGVGDADNLMELEKVDDVAYNTLHGNWSMPTKADFEELLDTKNYCDWTWQAEGTKGYWVSKKDDSSKKIFLPVTGKYNGTSLGSGTTEGYYWAKSLKSGNSTQSAILLTSSSSHAMNNYPRYYGCPIRPVFK